MSQARTKRALERLCGPGAVLAAYGYGFGVFTSGDRRRRPVVRLTRDEVRALVSDGALRALGAERYALRDAGRARVARGS